MELRVAAKLAPVRLHGMHAGAQGPRFGRPMPVGKLHAYEPDATLTLCKRPLEAYERLDRAFRRLPLAKRCNACDAIAPEKSRLGQVR